MKILFAIVALAVSLAAQTVPHSVTLTWTNPEPGAPGMTFSVYRADVACPETGIPKFTKLASDIAVTTYVDLAVVAGGNYCYVATAARGGAESAYSNTAGGLIRPFSIVDLKWSQNDGVVLNLTPAPIQK